MAAAILTQIDAELTDQHVTEKQALKTFVERCPNVHAIGAEILIARWSKTYEKKIRLVVGFGYPAKSLSIDQIYLNWMMAHNAERKFGEAPKGPKERKVIELLGLGDNNSEDWTRRR